MNLWPPLLFAGIRVLRLSDGERYARVRLRQHRWNRNYVGTHFGGSLFAMVDPFWMLLVMRALGREFIVWDKAGEIEFVRPGRGDVFAEFRLTDEHLDALRRDVERDGKALMWFDTDVVTAEGELVAHVRKQVYVRGKDRARAADTAA
jgi:acyl-coenzyme A thioesterase PaaI-like protein